MKSIPKKGGISFGGGYYLAKKTEFLGQWVLSTGYNSLSKERAICRHPFHFQLEHGKNQTNLPISTVPTLGKTHFSLAPNEETGGILFGQLKLGPGGGTLLGGRVYPIQRGQANLSPPFRQGPQTISKGWTPCQFSSCSVRHEIS